MITLTLENGLYGYGADSGSGTYFENTIVVQYDPQVQEVWDQARKLRCTWHDQYEKSVTFRWEFFCILVGNKLVQLALPIFISNEICMECFFNSISIL